MSLMKTALQQAHHKFTLFGGEPLLLPEEDLEDLWSWGFEKFGSNSVQTNGTLVNDRHLRMFKQYRVSVGVSCDGPGEMNGFRWAGSLRATRQATERTLQTIEQLCQAGIPPSIIITLHRNNATTDKLPVLFEWLRSLEQMGVRSVRLHILEVDDSKARAQCELTVEENMQAFLFLAHAMKRLHTLRFDVFTDIREILIGKDRNTTCIWGACDPYTTSAVSGIEGHGQKSNCGRTNKDGIDFVKADTPGYERYLALFHAAQEDGGCRGCRFFVMCKGQCPGTAIDGDWRNRTEHCAIWKALFEFFEEQLLAEGKTPISLHQQRPNLENWFIASWTMGNNPRMESYLEKHRSCFEN
jgi:uncharacterized protein